MKPLNNIKQYLDGGCKLPAGAIPMCEGYRDRFMACLMPDGSWILVDASGDLTGILDGNHGPEVLKVICEHLELTTAKLAGLLEVSEATVNGWRAGNALPIARAYQIMQLQAQMEE